MIKKSKPWDFWCSGSFDKVSFIILNLGKGLHTFIHELLVRTFSLYDKYKSTKWSQPGHRQLLVTFAKQLKGFKRVAALNAYSSVAFKTQLCPTLHTTLMSLFSEDSFLYRTSLLFTFCGAFFWTWLFFFSLCGFTVAAVFCSLFCSIAAHCALCDSLYETPLSCSSRGRLNFSLHGPFVRKSCTVLRPWHCTVEMQQDLSCVYLSSPSFHINVNLCLGIGTGMHVSAGSQRASGEIRGVLASQSTGFGL